MPIGYELSRHFGELAQETEREEWELSRLSGEISGTRARIERAHDAAAMTLAAIYLPELSAASIVESQRLSGFRGFARYDPIKAMERERRRLEQELAALRVDERYVRRDYLVGPHGSITGRLSEARSMLDPWELECQRFESLPSFLDLVQSGYDTDHFDKRWWQPSYWRLWAAGDAICAALGLADFGDDVLPAYEKVRAPRDQWRAQVASIEGERDQILGLVHRHDSDTDRLARLHEIYLEEAQRALAEHLKLADAGLLEQWAGEDRGIIAAVRVLAGTGAKIRHLQELEQGVGQWQQTLSSRRAQYEQKSSKYRYGKKAGRHYPDTAWSNKPHTALAKSALRREKLHNQLGRIERYDRYDRFDLTSNAPELWWYEFTGSAPPVWSPGLRAWYQRNPQVAVIFDEHDHHHHHHHTSAISETLTDRSLDDLGDLS